MKRSNLIPPLLFVFALASISTLLGFGRCLTGACAVIPMPKAWAAGVAPQQGPGRGQVTTPRDPDLEVQFRKSLETAWYYFKKKPDKSDPGSLERLNKAVESRLTEILDTYPEFTKIDEVYFLLGEVYYRGRQPEKAIEYLGKVVKDYPDSRFSKDAKKHLDELNAGQANKKSQPHASPQHKEN
jgi:outer membrane protein assembly factor BamD